MSFIGGSTVAAITSVCLTSILLYNNIFLFSLSFLESPTISPSLLRELAVLDHFKIKLVPKEHKFDKSTTLHCSLEDSGLPEVPALTVTIPPNYPSVSPICNLNHYHDNSVPFLKSIGKLLSEKLMRSHWTYSLSLLLTSWEDSVLRAMARELTSLEE